MRQTGVRLSVLAGPDPRKLAKKRGEGVQLDVFGLRLIDAQESLDTEYLQYRGETNKRDKQYPIYLNKTARNCLKGLIAIHKKNTADHVFDVPRLESALILSRRREPLKRRSFQDRMSDWCKEAGVTVGSPHWLRHTWAKRYLERSTSPDALRHVQAVLGHSNLNTTSVYTAPDKETLKRAMQVAQ